MVEYILKLCDALNIPYIDYMGGYWLGGIAVEENSESITSALAYITGCVEAMRVLKLITVNE